MKIAIIDYNAGNIKSVMFALERLGIEHILTNKKEEIIAADKIIFPGQGQAASAMKSVTYAGLDDVIRNAKQPFLGICIGMQLMCNHSEEADTKCLNVFPLNVKRFVADEISTETQKIPQMGWNNIHNLKGELFNGIPENSYMYFIHSYYVEFSEYTSATTDYILPYSAALHKDNFYATQFHPEKSGDIGEKIIENFVKNI